MNYNSELNKPVLLLDGRPLTLRQLATAKKGGVHEARALFGSRFESFAANFSMINEKVASYGRDDSRRLAIERLKAVPASKVYKFMSGQKFTPTEAIREIERGTEVGDYFAKLEKHAAELALDALASGKISL